MIGLPLGIGDGGSISKESTTEQMGDPIVPYMAQILLQRPGDPWLKLETFFQNHYGQQIMLAPCTIRCQS